MNKQRRKLKIWILPFVIIFKLIRRIIFPADKNTLPNRYVAQKRLASVLLALAAFISIILIFPHLHLDLFLGMRLAALIGAFLPFLALLLTIVLTMEFIEDLYKKRAAPIAQAILDGTLSPAEESIYTRKLLELLKGIEASGKPIRLKKGLSCTLSEDFIEIEHCS